jgi:hypothetical protein
MSFTLHKIYNSLKSNCYFNEAFKMLIAGLSKNCGIPEFFEPSYKVNFYKEQNGLS